jgi:hypothetical protein
LLSGDADLKNVAAAVKVEHSLAKPVAMSAFLAELDAARNDARMQSSPPQLMK